MTIDSPFVEHYLDAMRPTLWPIYLTLALLVGWMGFISVRTLFDPLDPGSAAGFARNVKLLVYIIVAIPFARPALVAAGRCWAEDGDRS
jgi:hypothetical protein